MGLVLDRKRGESIIIETSDGLIEVRLNSSNDKRAKLWIDAPRFVSVDRKEVYKRKKAA